MKSLSQACFVFLSVLSATLIFAACTKEKRSSNPVTNPPAAATLSSIHTDILLRSCAVSGCHDNRATPAGSLNLSAVDAAYGGLVDRASTQATNLKIVAPGNSANSYLVNKLMGTHAGVGGSGDRMPQFASALSTEEVERIVTWISNGAQKN